jgi:hypothetical protein
VKRRLPAFTWISASIAGALLATFGIVILAVVFLALGLVWYGVWQAVVRHDATLLWALPVGVLGFATDTVIKLPGYVWVALLVVFWLEWRLARLEHSIWSVAKAIRRLRRKRLSPSELDANDC